MWSKFGIFKILGFGDFVILQVWDLGFLDCGVFWDFGTLGCLNLKSLRNLGFCDFGMIGL